MSATRLARIARFLTRVQSLMRTPWRHSLETRRRFERHPGATPMAQEASAISGRKAIYEESHPETKAAVAGASARWKTDVMMQTKNLRLHRRHRKQPGKAGAL
jgi:hypothetical protein